jgi:hypothetical protein
MTIRRIGTAAREPSGLESLRWIERRPQCGKVGHPTRACSLKREFNIRFDIDDPMPENFWQIIRVARLKLGGRAA